MTAGDPGPADRTVPGLRLRDDPERVGFAMLEVEPAPEGPLAISIRFLDRSYLNPDGRRGGERHLFAAEPRSAPGTYSLGPAVTAHVPEAEVVTLADREGTVLGRIPWENIRPPPGHRSGAFAGATSHVGVGAVLRGDVTVRVPPAVASAFPAADETGATVAGGGTAPAASAAERGAGVTAGPALVRLRNPAAAMVLWAAIPLMIAILLVAAVLSGRIGWTAEPTVLAFVVQPDARAPARQEAALIPRWYARPFVPLLGDVFRGSAAPAGLVLEASGLALRVTIRGDALPASGEQRLRVPVIFPLGGDSAGLTVEVVLRIDPPAVVPAPLPVPATPVVAAIGIDDAACGKAAGSRFDPDHPTDGGFVDDVFDMPGGAVDGGIAACDPRRGRTGVDRRFLVQRGRLLAARALLRAASGEPAEARRDMDEALGAWQSGSQRGSAFADSLLGSYALGTLNRPAMTFVEPNDAAAATDWKRGMERGSVVAQRNYAAQLMTGQGIAADPLKAVALLRDAVARGDERAAGVLGVALYTGFPTMVGMDKAEGWSLMVRAQCIDKVSRDLMTAEVQRGLHATADRRACS